MQIQVVALTRVVYETDYGYLYPLTWEFIMKKCNVCGTEFCPEVSDIQDDICDECQQSLMEETEWEGCFSCGCADTCLCDNRNW